MNENLLKELFEYRDGTLYKKRRGRNSHLPQKVAGYLQNGYRVVEINGKPYKAHRLI